MKWIPFITDKKPDARLKIGETYLLCLQGQKYALGIYSEYNGNKFWFRQNMRGSISDVFWFAEIEKPIEME